MNNRLRSVIVLLLVAALWPIALPLLRSFDQIHERATSAARDGSRNNLRPSSDDSTDLGRRARTRDGRPTVEQRLSAWRDKRAARNRTRENSLARQSPPDRDASPRNGNTATETGSDLNGAQRPAVVRPDPEAEILRDGIIIYEPGLLCGNPVNERDFPGGQVMIANVSGGVYSVNFISTGNSTASIYGHVLTKDDYVQVDDVVDVQVSGALQIRIVPKPGTVFEPETPNSAG